MALEYSLGFRVSLVQDKLKIFTTCHSLSGLKLLRPCIAVRNLIFVIFWALTISIKAL